MVIKSNIRMYIFLPNIKTTLIIVIIRLVTKIQMKKWHKIMKFGKKLLGKKKIKLIKKIKNKMNTKKIHNI